jgi:hypothetical protein
VDAAGNVSAATVAAISTLPDNSPPTAPGNLTATPDYHSIELAWEASTDDIGVAVYEIWRGADLLGTVLGLAYSDSNLDDGTAYVYKVIAKDAAGNASAAAQVNVSTLGFEDWLTGYGLTGEIVGDSDHGGLDNLSEYYLGMNPNDPRDDLSFHLVCSHGTSTVNIVFPDLKPVGNYYLNSSDTLEDIGNPAHRIHTITRAEIESMTEAERSGKSIDIPAAGAKAFFILIFEPSGS